MQCLRNLVGYRLFGRQGELGRVVDTEGVLDDPATTAIVVRGGVSEALVYHVPATSVVSISRETATIRADVDVGDFLPSFGQGGTVELRIG